MTAKAEETKPKSVGRSINEFRELYDKAYIVPRKIKAGLEKLGDGWLRELDFAKLAGVTPIDLAAFRAQFEDDHVVTLTGADRGKRAWAGTKRVAMKLREMLQ